MSLLTKLPALFVAHGGGPLPVLGDPGHAGLTRALKQLPAQINVSRPAAILVISAHWEEPVATVTTHPNPPMIYDYYGFPPESYALTYPAPGHPVLAQRVASLLTAAGIACKTDSKRGFDHGTYIPLMLAYPKADIPTIQLSLVSSLDPGTHVAIGEALAPLREENVLIVASGMTFHNMGVLMQGMRGKGPVDAKSKEFDDYLHAAVTASSGEKRKEMLLKWAKGPHAKYAHPREEHLIPLLVAAGASKGEPGRVLFSEPLFAAQVSSFVFGGEDVHTANDEL